MSKIIIAIILTLLFGSCKINQTKNGLKTGKWITEKTYFNSVSKSIGKYKKGNKIGNWNYYYKDQVSLNEIYKKDICYIIEYHNTGKIRAIGQKKIHQDSIKTEWVATGEWKFYDSEGVMLGTKIYDKGIPTLETYNE